MTQVNNLTNRATVIAKELDKKDGNTDNKISASIWNSYVADKGGNTIKHSISLENAIKSITVYAQRGANIELDATNATNTTKTTETKENNAVTNGESYNQYKKRTEAENVDKVIEKHKGEALETIAITKGADYVPTEQELCDTIAKNLEFVLDTFIMTDPANEFDDRVVSIYSPDFPPKSPAERYKHAKEEALNAVKDLETIMSKLSKEMQDKIQEKIDIIKKKVSGTFIERWSNVLKARRENNNAEPNEKTATENANKSNIENSGFLGQLKNLFN